MNADQKTLCNLRVPSVSVVVFATDWITTETQSTRRLHRENPN